jgi:hypothetical protein
MGTARFVSGLVLFVASAGAALVACSGGNPSDPLFQPSPAPNTGTSGPTFHKDIEPILQDHCQGCHSPGNIAPISLMTYADVGPVAGVVAIQTSQRLMPPWGAPTTSECTPPFPWKNDLSLTDAQIATIQAWSQAGAPEGDPKDAPPPRPPSAPGLPGLQADLAPQAPFTAGGSQDEFRCFVLDPKLTSLAYVNGVFFVPGNAKVVHHAVLVTDPTGASAAMADATGSFDCFSFPALPNEAVLGVWTPGGVPIELPPNMGTPMVAGSKLVLQIHYHPAGVASSAPDLTHVQLRYTSARPDYILVTTAVGNYPYALPNGDGRIPQPDDPATGPLFRIPANSSGHIEEMQFTMPATINGAYVPTIWIYGLMGHMHLAGQDIKVDLLKTSTPAGTDTCLMQDPNWRFAWQRFYAYDAPIAQLPILAPGDKIRVRCTYDNTTNNQQLEAARKDQTNGIPTDIYLGEQTLDEMCLAIPQLLVKNTL